MDLHNLLHFLRLRLNPHAQQEIREFANAIAEIVKVWVPWTWEAFEDYQLESMQISRMEIKGLKAILSELRFHDEDSGDALVAQGVRASGLKGREKKELTAKLERLMAVSE